jgi:hypothetical protein
LALDLEVCTKDPILAPPTSLNNWVKSENVGEFRRWKISPGGRCKFLIDDLKDPSSRTCGIFMDLEGGASTLPRGLIERNMSACFGFDGLTDGGGGTSAHVHSRSPASSL